MHEEEIICVLEPIYFCILNVFLRKLKIFNFFLCFNFFFVFSDSFDVLILIINFKYIYYFNILLKKTLKNNAIVILNRILIIIGFKTSKQSSSLQRQAFFLIYSTMGSFNMHFISNI